MSLPRLSAASADPDGCALWWYDAARCMFVRGLWPVIEDCWSEELVRQVAEEPGLSRRKVFAAMLLLMIPADAERFERRSA